MLRLPLVLLSFVASFTGTEANSKFISPPGDGESGNYRDNPQYHIGERMSIRWQTDLPAVNLLLQFPVPGEPGVSAMQGLGSNLTNGAGEWIVNIQGIPQAQETLDKEGLAVLYLAIYPTPKGDLVASSHYFNLTTAPSPPEPSTLTPKPTTSSSISISSSASSTTSIATTTNTETSGSQSPTGGSPSAAVVGGAVGGVLGGVIVLGAIAVWIWTRSRKRHYGAAPATEPEHPKTCTLVQPQLQNEIAELDGARYPTELQS